MLCTAYSEYPQSLVHCAVERSYESKILVFFHYILNQYIVQRHIILNLVLTDNTDCLKKTCKPLQCSGFTVKLSYTSAIMSVVGTALFWMSYVSTIPNGFLVDRLKFRLGILGKRWDSRKIMGFQQTHGIPAER